MNIFSLYPPSPYNVHNMPGIPVKQIKKQAATYWKDQWAEVTFPQNSKYTKRLSEMDLKDKNKPHWSWALWEKAHQAKNMRKKRNSPQKCKREHVLGQQENFMARLSLYLLLPIIWFTQKQPSKSSRNHLANKAEAALQIMWKPWLSRKNVEKSCRNTIEIKHKPPPSQADGLKRGGVDTGQRFVCAWWRVM